MKAGRRRTSASDTAFLVLWWITELLRQVGDEVHVHACFLDRECRAVDAPKRLYVNTKRFGSLSIGARTRGWLPFIGGMPWRLKSRWLAQLMWWPIVWTPNEPKRGYLARRWPELYGLRRDEGESSEVTKEVCTEDTASG